MSGQRTAGSSVGRSMKPMADADPVSEMTVRASSSMVISVGLPRFTGPRRSEAAMARMPRTVSSTYASERVCRPSPVTVSGSPASACRTKVGTARPS
jgi:hypothetical protein